MTDPERGEGRTEGTPVEAATVGDLVARDRRSDRPAVTDVRRERTRSYADFCTTAYKVGNVLRHLGVHAGSRVTIEPTAAPQPLLAFFGSALLGATAAFDAEPGTDARVVVVDAARESEFDPPGGSRLCVFGDAPDRPDTTHWETEVWSENPAFPPGSHDPESAVIAADATTYSHAAVLGAARGAAAALGLDADDRVALRAPLADPRAVAAGVLAPLLVGASVRLPADGGFEPADATAAVVAASAAGLDVPTLSLADVSL